MTSNNYGSKSHFDHAMDEADNKRKEQRERMTTIPAPDAGLATDLRALFEKMTAAKYRPELARGLHLKNPDGSFQVSSIEMSFRDWRDGYRAASLAAVPASEPVAWAVEANIGTGVRAFVKFTTDEAEADRFAKRRQAEYSGAERVKVGLYRGAAPAPVSGMPDLSKGGA